MPVASTRPRRPATIGHRRAPHGLPEYLGPKDWSCSWTTSWRCKTIALADIIHQSGATLCAIGAVIEKIYEPGRENLASLGVPIIALARVDLVEERVVVL